MTKKPTKSSLHPYGFPSLSETVEGLKRGLAQLGSHLVGAGAGVVANLIAPLAKLRQSAQEGDEDSEQAYLEAVAMLRSSESSAAESMLKELGELLGEEEVNEETSQNMPEPEADEIDLGSSRGFPAEPEDAPAEAPAEADTAQALEDSVQNDKIMCLECGKSFKKLTHGHLAKHGMNAWEYKIRHGLPMDIPLSGRAVAREEAERRAA